MADHEATLDSIQGDTMVLSLGGILANVNIAEFTAATGLTPIDWNSERDQKDFPEAYARHLAREASAKADAG